jgi:hypothetical protein
MSASVLGRPRAISGAALRTILEDALGEHPGLAGRVAGVRRRRSPYGSSFALHEVDVTLDDGAVVRMMFKDLGRDALLAEARRVKPPFLYDPMREIEVYRTLLGPNGLSTATCYGAVVDEHLGRYWLFLERVPGVELYQVGEFETWESVAAWLAGLHDTFAGPAEQLERAGHLLRHDGSFYRRWMDRALAMASRRHDPRATSGLGWLARRYHEVVERLASLPRTLAHGDCFASNVLVHRRGQDVRVCPVDWEMAAVGPGLLDLAALTLGGWTRKERRALALAYRSAADPSRLADVGTFLADLDACRLHLAVQCLAWSPTWRPPAEHARDWLGEALRLGEELGL